PVRARAAHRRPPGAARALLRPRHAGTAHRGQSQRVRLAARSRSRRRAGHARGNPRARQARDAVSEPAEPAIEPWRRTSRLGFLVRAIVGLRNLVLPALAVGYGSREWEGAGFLVVPLLMIGVGISLFASWLGWRHFRYRL